jgi:DNA-binding CsgD family transcriptional regulator
VYAVVDKCDAFHKLQSVINRFASQHRPAGVRVGGESLPERVPLSTREKEILLLIGRGKTSLAIAEELGISVHTVNVHRKKVAAKLGVRGNELRLQAFRYCQAVDSHRGTPSAE